MNIQTFISNNLIIIIGILSPIATILAVFIANKLSTKRYNSDIDRTTQRYEDDIRRTEQRYEDEIKRLKDDQMRNERISVFKQLMATRNINDYERVKAINCIDIIFSDCKKVTEACVLYIKNMKEYEANRNDTAIKKAADDSELELLKHIAENLGYTNIDISAIMHNSFQPQWLNERRYMEYFMMDKMEEALKKFSPPSSSPNNDINNAVNSLLCNNCKTKITKCQNSLCIKCKDKLY